MKRFKLQLSQSHIQFIERYYRVCCNWQWCKCTHTSDLINRLYIMQCVFSVYEFNIISHVYLFFYSFIFILLLFHLLNWLTNFESRNNWLHMSVNVHDNPNSSQSLTAVSRSPLLWRRQTLSLNTEVTILVIRSPTTNFLRSCPLDESFLCPAIQPVHSLVYFAGVLHRIVE